MKPGLVINLSLAAMLSAGTIAAAQGPREGIGPDMGAGMGPGMGGPGFGMHRPPLEEILGLHGAQGRWWNNPNVVEKLKLTDDQRQQMDAILLNHREKLIDMRAAVEKSELQLEPLIGGDQPNEAQILAQIDKVAQARAELEKANARFLLALRAKLTPEQWKELKTLRAERMEHMRSAERFERRRGPDGRDGSKPQGSPPPGTPGPGPQGMLNELPGPGMPGADADTGTR